MDELNALGHATFAVAIHDRHIDPSCNDAPTLLQTTSSLKQEARFSCSQRWAARIQATAKIIEEFRPDWTSLQYVPHGFQKKGLPLLLPSRLARLRACGSWHLMFHELWVLPQKRISFKDCIISAAQRAIARRIPSILKPSRIHTSNPVYQQRLRDAGIQSAILPLLSNIPLQNPPRFSREEFLSSILPGLDPRNVWIFVVFGSLRRAGLNADLLAQIEAARVCASKTHCVFVSIGRAGEQGEAVWEELKTCENPFFSFEKVGEIPSGDVSSFLQVADFGIALTPVHLLGKSGGVSAMRSHGLPVVCNDSPCVAADLKSFDRSAADGFLNSSAPSFPQKLAQQRRGTPVDPARSIAEHFVKSLTSF
jgi:hypothetical protein